jgi:hypothetical protein
LQIHVPQCKKKFIAQQKLQAPQDRKALPKTPPGWGGAPLPSPVAEQLPTSRPSTGAGGSVGGAPDWTQMSDAQIAAMNAAANETFTTQAMSKCENCGRTFLQERLAIHHRSCTPGTPAASVQKFIQRGQAGGGGAHGVITSPITQRRPNTTQGFRGSPRQSRSLSSTAGAPPQAAAPQATYPEPQAIQAALQASLPHVAASMPTEDVSGRLVELECVVADMARSLQRLTVDMGRALQQMAELRAQVVPGKPASSLPQIGSYT